MSLLASSLDAIQGVAFNGGSQGNPTGPGLPTPAKFRDQLATAPNQPPALRVVTGAAGAASGLRLSFLSPSTPGRSDRSNWRSWHPALLPELPEWRQAEWQELARRPLGAWQEMRRQLPAPWSELIRSPWEKQRSPEFRPLPHSSRPRSKPDPNRRGEQTQKERGEPLPALLRSDMAKRSVTFSVL